MSRSGCRICACRSTTAPRSTSPGRESPTPRRCATPSRGRRGTPGSSPHEWQPLERAHPRRADDHRLSSGDDVSAETAPDDAASPEPADQDGAGHALKTHWAAVAALFLVATAWGATFTVIKDVL